jgi:small subunit ribosomal protein S7
LKNASPEVEIRSRRVGGANYQIPMPVSEARQSSLAIRWIVEGARGQKGTDITSLLSKELLNAYNNTGSAVKKKDDVIRMAEANKAFSHFAGI